MADLLQVIRTRVTRVLVRPRVVEADSDANTRLLPDDLAEREPALAQLAAAAVSGLPSAGPELRRKPLKITLPTASGPKVVRPLCVDDAGFSLQAATRAWAQDDLGREEQICIETAHSPGARHVDGRRPRRGETETPIS